jgi:hypothetical protein
MVWITGTKIPTWELEPACLHAYIAARMAALPDTFSSSCVSEAHDNCSENTPWELEL